MASDVASATMSAGRNIALAVHAATLRITSRRHSSYAASDYVANQHRTAAKNQCGKCCSHELVTAGGAYREAAARIQRMVLHHGHLHPVLDQQGLYGEANGREVGFVFSHSRRRNRRYCPRLATHGIALAELAL